MTNRRLLVAPLLTTVALGAAPVRGDERIVTETSTHTLVFTVDVAEDFTLFTHTNVHPDDPYPKRGATFITEGRIFPEGTIPQDPSGFDPNTPGAIGKWYCSGIHLVAAPEIPAAALWVVTDQQYELPSQGRMLATSGLEGSGVVTRTVTGATGPLKGWVGEQRQRFMGFNQSGGVSLRVTFSLRRAAN